MLQGWRADPFGRYEERYFSDGVATSLVRTGRVEASDDPDGAVATYAPSYAPSYAPPEPAPVVRTRVVECVLVQPRRGRTRFILALCFLAVPLAFALLAPTGSGRLMLLLTSAGLAAMVALLVGGSAVLRRRERRQRPL